MTTLLEIDGLRTHIRQRRGLVRAVDGVSLRVDAGETLGLVGESGCGKSMTAMSILRLLPPGGFIAGGSIRFEDRDLVTLDGDDMRHVRGNDISVVFQDPMTALNPTMTVGRQVAEPLILHRRWPLSRALERAEEVLALVGLPRPHERLHQYPHQLSGGMRQRVVIAIALACEPRLVIADEPTTALDVTIQAQILDLLDDLKRRLDLAVLLITHDLGVVAGRTDRVAVMYAGKIVEEAATGELFGHRHHPYTEALLSSIPRADQDPDQPLISIAGLPPDLAMPPAGCRFHPRCTRASAVCAEAEPPLAGAGEHRYACFHPVGGAEPSGRPASAGAPA
jgi:peptide/nickel transport system ATP-binding protein